MAWEKEGRRWQTWHEALSAVGKVEVGSNSPITKLSTRRKEMQGSMKGQTRVGSRDGGKTWIKPLLAGWNGD